jgi:hypothetical protein
MPISNIYIQHAENTKKEDFQWKAAASYGWQKVYYFGRENTKSDIW